MSPIFMFRTVQECIVTWDHPRLKYHINMGPSDNGYGSVGTSEVHDDLTDALITDRHNGHTDRLVRQLFKMATCNSQSYVEHRGHSCILAPFEMWSLTSSLVHLAFILHVFHVTPLRLPSERACICSHKRTDTRKCQQLRHPCGALTFVTGNGTSVRVLRSPTQKSQDCLCVRACAWASVHVHTQTHTHTQCSA
jgi:hypothetical protein